MYHQKYMFQHDNARANAFRVISDFLQQHRLEPDLNQQSTRGTARKDGLFKCMG